MAVLPVAPIKVKYHVGPLLTLTNAFVDVFNDDSAFTFSEVPMISLLESDRSGSVCNFVLKKALCNLSTQICVGSGLYNKQYILQVEVYGNKTWGQRWLCCLLPPSFLQKLQVHLKLQMRSIRECDYSEV